jgi:hypothetical protein
MGKVATVFGFGQIARVLTVEQENWSGQSSKSKIDWVIMMNEKT